MMIKTDLSSIALNRSTLNRDTAPPPVARNTAETSRMSPHSIVNRLTIERSLGDALSIAQMSQNIIQKAMAISLRLSNIAASAMASGRINTQELNETLSDIRSALGSYGEEVPAPMQIGSAPSANRGGTPDVRNAVKSIQAIAHNLQNGDNNQSESIEAVRRHLGEQLNNYRLSENRITALMRETAPETAATAPLTAGALADQIRTSIEANPQRALSIQGNINHAAAERLMA